MAFQLGVQESRGSNRKYISLRTGHLCEDSKEEKEGFLPAFTENSAGKRTHFYAKNYEAITGFVNDLKWRVKTLDDGTELKGWDVVVDTGDPETEFLIRIAENDHPFQRFMNCLANCDFTQPIKFSAFRGNGNRKVLCLYQDDTPGAKPVQPKYRECWLNKELLQKLRSGGTPNEEEKKELVFSANGEILKAMKYDEDEGRLSETGYPYITQKVDGKWNFAAWTAFLKEKMKQDVIPAIEAATLQRRNEGARHLVTAAPKNGAPDTFGNNTGDAVEPVDDEIPF